MATFLVLYVDDILLIENDIPVLQNVKIWLSSQFSMKDLREVSYILEMKVYKDRSKRLLSLFQSTYIDTMLKRFNMENFKKGYLSIDQEIFFFKKDCPTTSKERKQMSRISYASIVRSIMSVMTYTRLDVAYSLSVTSRY